MEEYARQCIREVAQLDQLEARLLQMKRDAHSRRLRVAIGVRLLRLSRLREMWQQPNRSNP